MFENLNDENFMLFAAKFYDNPNCHEVAEFEEDLARIKHLKRLFRKYKDNGVLKERLILNHLIVLYNVFEPKACTRMLSLKLFKYLPELKPFLLYLSYWPEQIESVDGENIKDEDINMDSRIISVLRNL